MHLPFLGRKNIFGRLPGIILDFPGEAFSGPGRAVTQPQDLRFWGAKKNFWEALGDHFGLPGGAFSGPGRAVSKPGIILAFWEFIIKDTPAH